MRFYLYEVHSQGGIASVMKKMILILGAIALLGLAISVLAADVNGKWESERQGRDGTVSKTYYEFTVKGTEVTGKMTSERGGTPTETPITEGKLEGNNLSFTIVRSFGGNEMKQLYKGVVEGDKITFTVEMEGGFGGMMGGRGGGGAPGGAAAGAPPTGGGGPPGGGGPRGPREIIATRVK
jgi:hypothetical protein